MTASRCLISVLGGLSLMLPLPVFAQTATPAPNKQNDVVELSPFSVTADTEKGYIASEAVTGPRVATKIADLPYAVSVITNEFMKDFDIINLAGDLNGFSASLNGVTSEGTFVLRGMSTNNNFYLRDGFYRLGMIDRVNTDRIEIIKGPNSAIYGATNPSGMINVVSKTPKFTPYESLTYTAGQYDLNRVEFNVNTPMGSPGGVRLANLVSFEASDSHTPSTYPTSSTTRIFDDTFVAQFKDGGKITAEFEWTRFFDVPGFSSVIPFEGSKGNLTPVIRPDLTYFNDVGPDTEKHRSSYSGYLTYEKRFSQVWSSRINGYWYRRPEFQFNAAANSSAFDPATQTFSARSVQWDELDQDGGAVQLDTLADYELFGGRVKNKTLFTIDYSQNYRFREVQDFNTNLYPAIAPVSVVNPVYVVPPLSAFNIVSRDDHSRADTLGFFVSQQMRMFQDRLISFVSLRRDVVAYDLIYGNQYSPKGGALKTPGQYLHYNSSAWSPAAGYNYKLTKHIALYGSYSQSFAPQLQTSKLGDPPLPNERSKGWDYGIKASYLDDKLIFTTGGYYIDRTGIKTTITDPFTGLTDTVAGGSTNSKGFEFEGTWQVTPDWIFVGNYSYVDAKITNNGKAVTDVGQVPVGVPVDQGSLSTTYRGLGGVRGLSLHVNLSYVGQAYPFSTQTTFQRNIVAPSYALLNPGVSYSWKEGAHHLKQSIRVSAKNVLNRDYVTSKYELGTKRGFYFAYSLDH